VPEGARSFREGLLLLRERDFARLFFARLVSAFGTAMVFVALPFGVLELVGAEHPEPVGYVIASATGSQLLFQLFGGALADRGSRQRMMVAADAVAMLAQGAMATLLLTGTATIPALMGLAAVMGISFSLHWPASVGLVPLVVKREQLQAANSLLSVANSTSMGLGAAAGGIMAATAGAGWAIALDSLTFATSAVLVASLRPRSQERKEESTSLLRDIRDGWREFTSHRWLWTIVAQFSILVMGFQATYAVIGPIVAEQSMGGAQDWGWIAGAFGAGLLFGGLLAMRLQIQRPMLVGVLCCFLLALLPYLLIGPSPLAVVAAGGFCAGAGIELFSVFWNTAVHTHVAPEALSRVSAYDIVGSMALAPIGEVFAGTLVASIGAPTTLWYATWLIIVPTALVLIVPEVRQLRDAGQVQMSSQLIDKNEES
jgi:MFS family permease